MKKLFLFVLALLSLMACSEEELLVDSSAQADQAVNGSLESKKNALTRAPSNSQQTVVIGGSKFYVNGEEIFFNGINTAWQPQSDYSLDFLGRNFDYNWWNAEFDRYKQNHINLARIWIHGAGNYSPSLNGDGLVTGATPQFWDDMDQLVALASSKGIYIMPTFWSFDMVKDSGSNNYTQYRQIINDQNKTQWYIEYFLIPFLNRYEDEPFVMGYDICNEPEHMWRDADCGNLSKDNVVRYVAMMASAINENSQKPVTVGSMWIIFNSNRYTSWNTYGGNNYSNSSLQSQYANNNAYLDFWSPHWYQWQSSSGPFETSVGYWLDNGNKPVLIGETPGYDVNSGSFNNCCNWNITMANYYKQSYQNGYAGVCAWKNPLEDDNYGNFNSIIAGTNDFYANYPNLVYPNSNSSGISAGAVYQLRCRSTGKVLEVAGGVNATSDGDNVQQWEYLGQINQQWQINEADNGYYSIIVQSSHKALDALSFGTTNGSNIGQWKYEAKTNQQWQILDLDNGFYSIVNRNSGKALDVENGLNSNEVGLNVQQWEVNGKTNQQWELIKIN